MRSISRKEITRWFNGGNTTVVNGGGGSGSGGSGGSGSAEYAAEAGHALRANEANHATTADEATNAVHAESATDLDNDSPVYNKFLRKDVADEASGLIGFLQGLWVGTREADPEHEGETILTKTIEAFTNGLLKVKSFIVNDLFGITSDGDATLRDITGRNATLTGNATVTGQVQAANLIAQVLNGTAFSTNGYFHGQDFMAGLGFGVETDANGRARLQTDDLYVLGRMIVNTLNIREVSYIGGSYLLTPAASTVEDVLPLYTADSDQRDTSKWSTEGSGTVVGYRLLWIADDGTTGTMNFWQQGDQAFCQTFNITQPGQYQTATNHFWWRLVCRVGQTTINNKTYHYADVANIQSVNIFDSQGRQLPIGDPRSLAGMGVGDYQGNVTVPEAGDKAVMLGSQINTDRQGAVQITAEGDASIGIYDGINNYNALNTHQIHFFSKNIVKMSSLRFEWTTADGKSTPPTVYRGEWQLDIYGNPPVSSWGDEWDYMDGRWTCVIPNGETTTEAPGTTAVNWITSSGQTGPAGDSYRDVSAFTKSVLAPATPTTTTYPPLPAGWTAAPENLVTSKWHSMFTMIETDPVGHPGEYGGFNAYNAQSLPDGLYWVRTRISFSITNDTDSIQFQLMINSHQYFYLYIYMMAPDTSAESCMSSDQTTITSYYDMLSTNGVQGVSLKTILLTGLSAGDHFIEVISPNYGTYNYDTGWRFFGASSGAYYDPFAIGTPSTWCSMAMFKNGVIETGTTWSTPAVWNGKDGRDGAVGATGATGAQGPTGENAAIYAINPIANTVVLKNNVYIPQVVSATYNVSRDGESVSGTFFMTKSLDGGAESSYAPGSNLTPGTDFQNGVRFLLYETVDGQNILRDSESIPLLKDGVDGLGSFVMDLTNEMSSVNVDENNHPTTTGQNVATGVKIYYGTTLITGATFSLTDNNGNSIPEGNTYSTAGMRYKLTNGVITVYFSQAATIDGKKEITIQATFTYNNQQQVMEKVLTVNGFKPGAEGPQGPAGITVLPEPSSVIINQSETDPSSYGLPIYIYFSVKQGNTDITYSITNTYFKDENGVIMGNISAEGSSSVPQYLYLSSLLASTINNKKTRGTITCRVTPTGGGYVDVRIPVALNYLGTFKSTVVNDVMTNVASSLWTNVTDKGTYTTIADFGSYVYGSKQLLLSLNSQVNEYTTDIAELQMTSKLISLEVTGTSGNLFNNPSMERDDGNTSSAYFPADWETDYLSYIYVNNGEIGFNGYKPIYASKGNFYQKVGSRLKTGTWHTLTFFIKGGSNSTSSNNISVQSSGIGLNSQVYVYRDGVQYEKQSGLNVLIPLSTSYERHTITFLTSSSINSDAYIRFKYNNKSFYIHTPRLVSMKTGGIDVAAGVVDITADNFRVTNNAGEQTLGLDANGNLALTGTVYAKNLYHNVQVTGYSTISSYSENITMADMVIIAMPAPSGSARFYLTLKLPNPSDYPGKVITLIGANPASDYIYIYLQYGSTTDIPTIWGYSGIGNQANLKYMHEIVVISYNNNGNYEWRVAKWTEADANGYNTLHDVLKGYV